MKHLISILLLTAIATMYFWVILGELNYIKDDLAVVLEQVTNQ